MTTEQTRIRIEAAALDSHDNMVVLRGVVNLDSLPHLGVDTYQREELSASQRRSIFEALDAGEPLPDLELGMRGETCREMSTGVVFLYDPVFIIDGLQRRQTVLEWVEKNPDKKVRLGAKVYFGTTMEWERDRFETLNVKRTKVSSNILLRNGCDTHPGLEMLYALSTKDRDFVMHNRITWSQQMRRLDVMTAMTFAKLVAGIHAHKTIEAKDLTQAPRSMDALHEGLGPNVVRANVRYFFDLIDECWGIKNVHYRDRATHLKSNFLYVIARILADHYDFWQGADENRLFVEVSLRRKLKQFPINDPTVIQLAGAAGKAMDMLYSMVVEHINSGKRTRRLRSRRPSPSLAAANDEESTDDASEGGAQAPAAVAAA